MGNVGTGLPSLPATWLFWKHGDPGVPNFMHAIFCGFLLSRLANVRFHRQIF